MMLTLFAVAAAVAAADPEVVDVSDYRANLRVYSDGHGHDIALWPGDSSHVFYGDGHTFYAFSVYLSEQNGSSFNAQFRDPRYGRAVDEAALDSQDGTTLHVHCGKRTTDLPMLPKATYKDMVAKAEFKRSPWPWSAYALARDDKGTYYYVDHGRFDDNKQAYHVFVGPRGNMHEEKLKNVVHDSAGDIFATADGTLRLVVGEKPETEWVANEKHIKLTSLPIDDNVLMIYNDLNVYKHFRYGTPCDDL